MATLVIFTTAIVARAQMSPGPLANAHAFLSGPTHCTQCHDADKHPPEFKCLDCHSDIRERLDQNRGLHPRLVGPDHSSQTCVKCHSDHNGRDFAIVHWEAPLTKFDHARTGYELNGKHAGLTCVSCHKPEFIPAAARATISMKDLTKTYLGLPTACTGCHVDEHHGQLASDCARCHGEMNWKPAIGFNHNQARYALTGAHRRVACAKCHTEVQAAKPYTKYVGLAFEDCKPCHADPHKGAFAGACKTCHTSDVDWIPTKVTGNFDHSKTRYPLSGKHTEVPCASCHKTADFSAPIPFQHCDDCHTKDPHNGQFAARPDHGDCASCHTVNGFKPSTFGVARHADTQFPLKERHITVACGKCHAPDPKGVDYKIADFSCMSCHEDIHGGQFKGEPYKDRCQSCHTESSFKPSTFTLERHATTRYPLTGAHRTVTCAECHKTPSAGLGEKAVSYHFTDLSCKGCHEDPHQGQFAARMNAPADGGTPAGCQACHTTNSWKDMQRFNHSTTEFPLTGAHRTVVCDKCHMPANPAEGIKGIIYSAAPTQCSGCHKDVHGGQFTGRFTGGCPTCHEVSGWKPARFDHDTQSTFKLTGAHRKVACAGCHRNGILPNGNAGVVYAKTPTECASCH